MNTRSAWVRLVFGHQPWSLRLGYEDSRGHRIQPASGTAWATVRSPSLPGDEPLPGEPTTLQWPRAATGWLLHLTAAMPAVHLLSDGTSRPTSLPVLLSVPAGSPVEPWHESLAARALDEAGLGHRRRSLVLETAGMDLEPFALPFHVMTTLPNAQLLRHEVSQLLPGLDDDALPFAVTVTSVGSADQAADADILVCRAAEVLPLLTGGWQGSPPRLIVADNAAGLPVRPSDVPAGCSLLTLSHRGALPPPEHALTDLLVRLLRELTHDLPVHEAIAAVSEASAGSTSWFGYRLYSSVGGLQALRLSSAFEVFRRETEPVLRYRSVARDLPTWPGTTPLDLPVTTEVHLAADLVQHASNDFLRESLGLSEMARASAASAHAASTIAAIERAGAGLAQAAPAQLDRLTAIQHRRATIWLSHDLSDPDPDRWDRLEPGMVLRRGRRYLLNVGVGLDVPGVDLVSASTPAIGPILPPAPEGGHELDVAVYSDAVSVVGEPVHRLRLLPFGPCKPVTFTIRMPSRGRSARVRVLVSYREHLVQAFSLHLALDRWEGHAPDSGTGMRLKLDYSRQEQLRDVPALPPRLLAVATNRSGTDGSHRLMFGSTGHALNLSEKLVQDTRSYFREQLTETFGALDTEGLLPADTFEQVIRTLARRGNKVYGALSSRIGVSDTAYQQRLWALRDAEEGTIQVLRLHPEFVFPWPMIYDWTLPTTPAELQSAPVCRGGTPGDRCGCGPTTGGVCVRGFWGIRLVVEELLSQEEVDDYVSEVLGARDAQAVVSTVGVEGDSWADRMVQSLSDELGASHFQPLSSADSLITRLWDETSRPAVLVVVGHLTKEQDPDEPDETRIRIGTVERFLYTSLLLQAKGDHQMQRWPVPYRPIVLLLGCDTGGEGLGEMHDFVSSLTSAGSAAVIGTEEKIDTRLAGELATALVPHLDTVGVGEGLRAWRSDLMRRGNPLGLLFTCFGSSGARVPSLRS